MSTCNPRDIIRPASGKLVERYRNGDTKDIIKVIMDSDATADKYVDPKAVECLLGATEMETLRNVWRFVKGNIKYRADRPGHEIVRSPGALFASGTGDCKSFSIAEAAILRRLGFRGIRYRFAGYRPGDNYTHVYVVVRSGGRDVIMDAVHSKFDDEVPYFRKKDIAAASVSGVAGLPRIPRISGDVQKFIRIGGFLAVLYGLYLVSNE